MKRNLLNPSKLVAKRALKMAEVGENSACIFFYYQAKLPQEGKKLRKF